MERKWSLVAVVGSTLVVSCSMYVYQRWFNAKKKEVKEKEQKEIKKEVINAKTKMETKTQPVPASSVPAPPVPAAAAGETQPILTEENNISMVQTMQTIQGQAGRGVALYKQEKYAQAIQYFSAALEALHRVPLSLNTRKNRLTVLLNRSKAYEKMRLYRQVITDCTEILSMGFHFCALERQAQAKRSMKNDMGALVDYTALLESGKGDFSDIIKDEMKQIQKEVLERELTDALDNKSNTTIPLPRASQLQKYFSSFIIKEDKTPVVSDDIEVLNKQIQRYLDLPSSVQYNPILGRLHLSRGLLHKQQGRYEESATELESACELVQREDEYYALAQLEHGTFLALKRNIKGATAAFSNCLESDPLNLMGRVRTALLLQTQQQWSNSRSAFDNVVEMFPQSATALYHRAGLYLDMGNLEGAQADTRQALHLEPGFVLCHLRLSEIYRQRNEFHASLASSLKALTVSTHRPPHIVLSNVYVSIGLSYFSLDKEKEAIDAWNQALLNDSTFEIALVLVGSLVHKNGQVEEAVRILKEALHLNLQSVPAYIALTQVYLDTKQYAEALVTTERAYQYAVEFQELKSVVHLRLQAEVYSLVTSQSKK